MPPPLTRQNSAVFNSFLLATVSATAPERVEMEASSWLPPAAHPHTPTTNQPPGFLQLDIEDAPDERKRSFFESC